MSGVEEIVRTALGRPGYPVPSLDDATDRVIAALGLGDACGHAPVFRDLAPCLLHAGHLGPHDHR